MTATEIKAAVELADRSLHKSYDLEPRAWNRRKVSALVLQGTNRKTLYAVPLEVVRMATRDVLTLAAAVKGLAGEVERLREIANFACCPACGWVYERDGCPTGDVDVPEQEDVG
jgi:hypothetical protein